MRLGQLARKLSRRPAEIVEFLASKGVRIDEGSNTRIQDDHVMSIIKEFAPSSLDEVASELAQEPKEPDTKEPEVEHEIENTPTFTSPESVDVGETKPEIIKAPKVELSGLKVLGKIELPEPKKKEVPAEGESVEIKETKQPQPALKNQNRNISRNKPLPKKNPIALQREREANEALKKREAEANERKEQKKRNYQNRVKASVPTKKMRLVEEPLEEMEVEAERPAPKTLIGKFFRWLKT